MSTGETGETSRPTDFVLASLLASKPAQDQLANGETGTYEWPGLLPSSRQRRHQVTISPQEGCITATFVGFPTWKEEMPYQRQYAGDSRFLDRLANTLHIILSCTLAYEAVTAWTISRRDAWMIAISTPAFYMAALAFSFMPDLPCKPLLRIAAIFLARAHNGLYVCRIMFKGMVAAKFRLSSLVDFVHLLSTAAHLMPLSFFALGLQVPFAVHLPLQFIQGVGAGYVTRGTCDQCSIFMQENFSSVATFLNKAFLGIMLLNPHLAATPINPEAACNMVIDICITLGIILPMTILWFYEVRHRARFRKQHIIEQYRAEGHPRWQKLPFDLEPLNVFPTAAIAALLSFTCMAWQVIVTAENAALRS